eukprot:806439-Pyramimonas_sp.AAC.1
MSRRTCCTRFGETSCDPRVGGRSPRRSRTATSTPAEDTEPIVGRLGNAMSFKPRTPHHEANAS